MVGFVDLLQYNQEAWDRKVAQQNEWTRPVCSERIAAAREGRFDVVLTPLLPVPKSWLGEIRGKDVLCLACGGGQQGPILAAAGAKVTVFDLSESQLGQDRAVAGRENLYMQFEQGDMRDLSRFDEASFDLVFHPVSNCFIPNVQPVWDESYRVLRPGGELLAGFANPVVFLVDIDDVEKDPPPITHSLPYSDSEALSTERLTKIKEDGEPLEFGHTLDTQIGGQLKAGFLLKGFFEDKDTYSKLTKYISTYLATRAVKLG
jgi:SAM-dependent methyltransferase